MIKAIIFDAEGVVIDTHPLWLKADLEFLHRRHIKPDIEKVHEKIVGSNLVAGTKIMQNMLSFDGDPEELAKERFEIIEDLFRSEINFIPGFLNFFKKISTSYKTAVGTAIRKELMDMVDEKLQLVKLFDGRIYHIADVNNLSKPDPAIFLYAAKKINAQPKDCLVIEDAPNGIEAARRAGMKSIGITTTFKADVLKGADQIVDSFSEIDLRRL